jgi:hypothetical protein
MILAAPVFLAALGLLVPVLITFLVRRQRQLVRVPSTMVWRLGARSVAKSRRFRDLRRLLALLACLAGVTALVVAAARPSGAREDVTVYVVDTSASMAGGPLDEARRWLSREVAARGPNARIALVVAGAEPRVALSPSPPGPKLDAAIAALVAEKDIASMDEAVSLAEALASSSGSRVVVLTDAPVDSEVSRHTTTIEQRLFSRVRQVAQDNLGIASLYTRTPPDAKDDEEREATITVATSSRMARRARLVVDFAGHVVADRRIDVPEHGETTERVSLRGGGRLVARVEPADGKPDVLAIDDEASLEESARRAPRVALVHQRSEKASSYFMEKAIRAAGITELIEVNPDGPPPGAIDVAVVLRDGSGRPSGIPTFYIGGETPRDLGMERQLVDKTGTHLRTAAFEDPLLRGVSLDDLTTLRAWVAKPPRGARTLIDLDAGPALVVGGGGPASWVWLGIDPQASDLVLRVAFPVLVANVLTHLAGSAQVVVAKTVPRAEVMLELTETSSPLPTAAEPRWRIPTSPAILLACVGAFLLALEAWLTFGRKAVAA